MSDSQAVGSTFGPGLSPCGENWAVGTPVAAGMVEAGNSPQWPWEV